jgi:hypothetical protein
MRYIDVIPQIRHDMFLARIVMSDYDVEEEMAIRITARRDDGAYMTKTIVYPEKDVEYNGEILVYFFGMSRSMVAQIVGLRINGVEVYTENTPVDDNNTARYSDSLTRYPKVEKPNNIKLDFEVVGTNNPKVLRVVDESEWGILANRPAVIEVKGPDMESAVSYYLGKNQLNIFTSVTLGYTCDKYEYENLPDGVYEITIKGSPSTYTFTRHYLKTDILRLNIDKVWARTNVLCDYVDDDLIEKIKKVEYIVAVAEANMRLGNIETAEELIEKANKLLYIINNCADCGCDV